MSSFKLTFKILLFLLLLSLFLKSVHSQNKSSIDKVKDNVEKSIKKTLEKVKVTKQEKIPAKEKFQKKVNISLGDGRNLSGMLRLEIPSKIKIQHTKNKINYFKEIQVQDILNLEFKSWQPEYVKRKKEGEIYRFVVNHYKINLKNGQSLDHYGNALPFLKEFEIRNVNGSVYLYTYWLDMYKKDKTWHTGMKGPLGKERILPHADIVTKISFE